jgi:dTDP-4-amino-4,6-dideoxygalactose transaminase
MAKFAGSKYAVGVNSCSSALFLCCVYRKVKEVTIPKVTYVSVACAVINAGGTLKFEDKPWEGTFELKPYKITDGALRFKKGMYVKGTLHCLSFSMKKNLSIGEAGMILTDDKKAYEWLKLARFDGRHEGVPLAEDNFTVCGWNMYMTPDRAARGLWVFDMIRNRDIPDMDSTKQGYPDLSKFPIFRK